jgi:4-amino-4-deoxy-L-arabinose transferase-like glycosyltransferase
MTRALWLRRHSGLLVAIGLVAVVGLGIWLPQRGLANLGPRALIDAGLALTLTVLLVLTATALGDEVLRLFSLVGLSLLERAVLSAGLGLGCLGTIAFAMGTMRLLSYGLIAGTLVVIAVLTRRAVAFWGKTAVELMRGAPAAFRRSSRWERAWFILIVWVFAVAAGLALAPSTAYDALMYHLMGPRLFLDAGAMFPSTTQWWINMPSLVESGYLYGIALGGDSVARLLHLTWALALMGCTLAVGWRWGRRSTGIWAIVILVGMPMLLLWGADADIDFGWAAFEGLSLTCLLIGCEARQSRWFILGGVFSGFALGSKYIALPGVVAFLLVLPVFAWRDGIRRLAAWGGVFLVAACLVALPWYLRNWIWLGDPLFPFLAGGERLDPVRLRSFFEYAASFRTATDPLAIALIPFRLLTQPYDFAERFPPSPLLLGALLYPLVRWSRGITVLALLVLARYVLWVLGPALNMRYLLPLLPWAAIVAAYAFGGISLSARWRRVGGVLLRGLATGFLLVTALVATGILVKDRVIEVAVGAISKDAYLRPLLPTYGAMAFARQNLPEGALILTTGEGRLYYCAGLCYPTDDQFLWMNLALQAVSGEDLAGSLAQRGITHLLVSEKDVSFLEDHVPGAQVERAMDFLQNRFIPQCGRLLFADIDTALYQIDCGSVLDASRDRTAPPATLGRPRSPTQARPVG